MKNEDTGSANRVYRILLILCFISLCLYIIVVITKAFIFDNECVSHLKNAGNASTLEVAREELGVALEYLEDNGLTIENISSDPKSDAVQWYEKLKSAYNEMVKLSAGSDEEETAYALDMVKETIYDGDVRVSVPDGVEKYPYNAIYFWWRTISIMMLAMIVVLSFLNVVHD